MNRLLRNQTFSQAAVIFALLLAFGFVAANFRLHWKITHWQRAIEVGAGAIRRLDAFERECEPVADLALATPPAAELKAAIRALAGKAEELALDAGIPPIGAVRPAETLRAVGRRLAATADSIVDPADSPVLERIEASRRVNSLVSGSRREVESIVTALRGELSTISLEMRESNELAQSLLVVSCGFAVLVVALLWFRQRDLLRSIEDDRRRHAADRHLAVLLERAPIIIWALDRELRLKLIRGAAIPDGASGAASAMTDRTLAEYFGTDDPMFPPMVHHRRALAGEPVGYAIRWQERDFVVHVEPWREGEQVIGVLGAALETTATTRMQAQLSQSQGRVRHLEKMEAIGRLADFVAHDFNNFLTVVLGYAGSVLQDLPPDSPIRFEVEEIARTAERATWLTRQLLAFSRPARIEAEAIDLSASIAALAPVLKRQCGDSIAVELDLAPTIPPILAHRTQVEQILLNLALNARDAMQNGGRLTITVAHEPAGAADRDDAPTEAAVTLQVRDSGVGMDEGVRARIFEPFFSTKADGHGSGLGLAIVDAIVRDCGGTIAVESAPGKGSTFTLRFPAALGVELDRVDEPAAPPPLGRGERVLLVEDDGAVRTLAARTLESHGYAVTAARGGLEALEFAAAGPPPDLLLTDEQMPRISGSDLISRLSEARPGLRAIVMSTHPPGSITAAASGSVRFLAKPFTVSELLTAVHGALDR